MIKKIIASFIIGSLFLFTGCNSIKNKVNNDKDLKESAKSIYFNNKIANSVAEDYMEALKNEDLDKIKNLSYKDIEKNIAISPSKDLEITGIKKAGVDQLGNRTIFKFYVTKTKKGEPKASLEQYYLEVKKTEDGEYKISELKSSDLYDIFLDKNKDKLKIRKDDEVEINTLIDLKSVPDKIYPKANVIDIAKVDVPKDSFSALEISFSGEKVAISTYKDGDSYIGVLDVDDAKEASSKEGESEGGKDEGGKDDKKDDDKTLGKKITSLDILTGCKISSLNFSDDDGYVVANYIKGDITRFKVYKNDGSIVSLRLDDIFAEDEYNLIYEKIKDNNIIMHVTPKVNSGNNGSDLIGRYKISLKDFKLEKL